MEPRRQAGRRAAGDPRDARQNLDSYQAFSSELVLQPGQEVEARVIKIDPIDRRIGLSIKAAKLAEDEFKVDDSMLEGLRPGEDLVDLAGAFDAALGSSDKPEEWSPGSKKE